MWPFHLTTLLAYWLHNVGRASFVSINHVDTMGKKTKMHTNLIDDDDDGGCFVETAVKRCATYAYTIHAHTHTQPSNTMVDE